jgi:hypothetical protein
VKHRNEKVLYEAEGKGLILRVAGIVSLGFERPDPVRRVTVTLGGRWAQWERRIWVYCVAPRKRRGATVTAPARRTMRRWRVTMRR